MKMTFNDIFIDSTKKGRKILKENYNSKGKIPIIDQGKNQISGFSDEKMGIYKEIPVIIFGDHTRIIKYVDYPFLLGADGVKILSIKTNKFIAKYLYYALLNYYIPDTGYNRHFKWLKNFTLNVNSIDEQKRIVIILDKIVTMIDKKKKQINLLEELVKSRFIEMFGDPIKNEKGWEDSYLKNLSVIIMGQSPPSNSYNNIGKGLPFYQGNIDFGDKYPKLNKFCSEPLKIAKKKSILMSVRAPVGEINITNWDCCIGRGLCSLELAESLNIEYLYNYLKNIIVTVKSKSRGSTFKSINKLEIENIRVLLPPLSLQNEFADFATKIDKLKFEAEESLKEMENLYESLMQKFFKQN